MNTVSFQDVFDEVGQLGMRDILRLYHWMQDTEQPPQRWKTIRCQDVVPHECLFPDWQCRFAPSIVCRSEAELFGVSSPRFGIRIYFDSNNLHFINLRRLASFFNNARWHSTRENTFPRLFWNYPGWHLRKNCCIADSVLQAPKWMSDFHILRATLGKAYGECLPGTADQEGTPFVKHIAAGGGLCAQAVCFMATTLLQNYARGVFGVAEVTALIKSGFDVKSGRDIELTGLKLPELVQYFEHPAVGLNAIWQNVEGTHPEARFREALRSYLLSEMPVVIPLDVGRMKGVKGAFYKDDKINYERSIFKRNGLAQDFHGPASGKRQHTHAVLAIGCHSTENLFAFNDPAHFPFMLASAEELMDAAIYSKSKQTTIRGIFLPVTPSQVQLPLCQTWIPNSRFSQPGLIKIAGVLQSGAYPLDTPGFPSVTGRGEFRLCRIRSLTEKGKNEDARYKKFSASGLAMGLDIELIRFAEHAERVKLVDCWVWIQSAGESLWVWNAEKPPPNPGELDKDRALDYLLFVAWKPMGSQMPESLMHPGIPSDSQIPPAGKLPTGVSRAKALNLSTSVMSSFSVNGIKEALEKWPENCMNCELYTFMQADLEHLEDTRSLRERKRKQQSRFTIWMRLLNRLRSTRPLIFASPLPAFAVTSPRSSAMDKMVAYADDDLAISRVAAHINNAFKNRPRTNIIGFASFFQGLAAPADSSLARDARAATGFLIRLATYLRPRHDVRTIELVAGSLIQGIACQNRKEGDDEYGKRKFTATCFPRLEAVDNLVTNLAQLVPVAERADVYLALEHEPGPLYVLGEWDQLLHFCQRVDALSPYIGLNLDVAHWGLLSRISPNQIKAHPEMYERFRHSHISSHGRGHFGDAPLEFADSELVETYSSLNDPREIREWLWFLEELAKKNHLFSKHVSMELEACKNHEIVALSFDDLEEYLNYPL